MQVLWGAAGMVVLLLIAFALSTDRRAIRPRTVLGALAIQLVFAFIVLRWDAGKQALSAVSSGVQRVIDSSKEGIDFLLGPVMPTNGATVVAFQVLPIIVFVASVTAVLYHWNVLQWVVRVVGGGLRAVLGTTRAESLNATANIFLGQTEAPLVVRPYLAGMTRSEFFAVMVGGLSTVAGSVMVGYALLGANLDHLIAASFMAAPAGLMMAKIIVPETEQPTGDAEHAATPSPERRGLAAWFSKNPKPAPAEKPEADTSTVDTGEPEKAGTATAVDDGEALETKPRNVIDAAATGASDGLKLALNVGAMLFAFVSLIALLNLVLGAFGGLVGLGDITFEQIIGYVFAPVMWLIGVPWDDAVVAGGFIGQKLVLNEFVAFSDFGPQAASFEPHTAIIITFALTGFANFSSLAILLGGLGGLVPSRRPLIAEFGMRAIAGGTLANLMSAAIAGMLI
ncbi:NupC/NupG family nucleoside CNT transporter [Saccharopolyspora sp. NFXS83]|uniref:NupC/NupG family nucleoside CNT transporter n=1 Tax=Saccharopolyspora sp. NFXS83 TaxID=2993560 RepID=UPI00224A61E8|nr:NupC/NupG family nucleoside CNT transporter [Saccharopolyspora sp. NFXS83]MCX2733055.1 NupC/NupG family nucleoside CNT transporter [Saccharopolyspora sp. NFXS83]